MSKYAMGVFSMLMCAYDGEGGQITSFWCLRNNDS